MSRHFMVEMQKLKKHLLELGALVEESVQNAVASVQRRDAALARTVIDGDARIDRREVDLEEECLKVLALHQPVAVDLRFTIMVLKVNNDLERIGDLATNIAKRAGDLAGHPVSNFPFGFSEMSGTVGSMVKWSLDALINRDQDLARKVCKADELVDEANRRAYDAVESAIRRAPEQVHSYLALLSVAKNLERIADHATNIAEDVLYLLEGAIVRHADSRS